MLGTISYEIGERRIAAPRTTPDAVMLQQYLAGMLKAGCRNAVLEVSSHALVQKRTAYVNFAATAFTNLTQDHLDYHETMEAYYEAKASLLRDLPAGRVGVINVDDPWGARLARENLLCDVIRTGIDSVADVRATMKTASLADSTFEIASPWGAHMVSLPLPGRHNVHNALVAYALACSLGCDAGSVVKALAHVSPVRGRLQRIPSNAPFDVFVDYAHTDDALRNVLDALRMHVNGRLIVVFGCGGGRDKQKRVLMGAVVHALADKAMITTDNPRNENPEDIIAAILSAFPEGADVETAVDRGEAIARVLEDAKSGDVICIAGKGHETYQEVEGRMLPFDDVEVVQRILEKLGY
jgi:UDP-N-acetylmuramoyl-L-alanyl-D-glutamate--2,6-diaminopimelate ligase